VIVLASVLAIWIVWLLQLPPRPEMWLVFVTGLPIVALGSRYAADRAHQPWRTFVTGTIDYHIVWLVLLVALGVQMQDTHGVTTDGVIYFTQLRSVLFDRDLDVAREFAYLQQPPRPAHIVPIGPIPIWLPLYLVVAAGEMLGRALGWWPAPSDPIAIGLTTPYIRAALISSFAVGAAGLVVVHALLRREFERWAALAATLLVLGGTSLFWYLVYEPSMTHAASFGFVAFFVAATARTFEYATPAIKGTVPFSAESARASGQDGAESLRGATSDRIDGAEYAEIAENWGVTVSAKSAIFLGMLLGLAFITRPQEAVFALLPAMFVLALPIPVSARVKGAARFAGWAFVGFLPFLVLQLAHSYVLFSREHLVLVGGEEGFLDPFRSRWSETLWSSWHGFLSWTPVAYIALIGTIAYGRRRWPWAVAAVLIVFAMAWINGATPDLGAGWSFGGRRFVSCLVVLAPGLALIAHSLMVRPVVALAMVAVAAIAWNFTLMAQYRSGAISRTEPVTFTEMLQHQAELYTKPPYFYPFAFPANALFAWRTGLPIDRYDLLGPEALRAEIDLKLEGNAGRFFLEGWGAPITGEGGSAWWTAASPATLVLPLALPTQGDVRVDIEARARLVTPVQRPRVTVLVNNREIGSFVADPDKPSIASLSSPREVWIDGFNRVSFVSEEPFRPLAIHRIRVGPE
jgi:hypothetical protein